MSGTLRFVERPAADTAIGPVVVMLEPVEPHSEPLRPPQAFRVISSTERFAPAFVAIAEGDSLVFVNAGSLSHRIFSADLGADVQIPVGPAESSPAQRIDRAGELRFFCSLHPEEHFSVLVTGDVFSSVVDGQGHFDVGPLPDGTYRLSIWSPRVKGLVRTVEIESGRPLVEPILLDPNLF